MAEELLDQKVLKGDTIGYRCYQQLDRLRADPDPERAISNYLHATCDEADRCGYRFDRSRICHPAFLLPQTEVTSGQMRYEMAHLAAKLKIRSFDDWERFVGVRCVEPCPLLVVGGPVAPWERTE